MIVFEWKHNPLKTMMGMMAGSGSSSGSSSSSSGSSGSSSSSSGSTGSDSGSSSNGSTGSTGSTNSGTTSTSTLGTNGYTPGGLNSGYADAGGGKYGSADAGKSTAAASSPYSYANNGIMSWDQSVGTDIAEDTRHAINNGVDQQTAFKNAITDAVGRYGDRAVHGAMAQAIDSGKGYFGWAPSVGKIGPIDMTGPKSLVDALFSPDKGLSNTFTFNQDKANAITAAENQAARAASYNERGAADSANKGLNTVTNPSVDTTPGPAATSASPAATNPSGGIVANDGSGGRASAFGNESTSSSNKGVVGSSSGVTNNGATVDNGSLASGGSGSLAAPSRNTDSIGFSKYNKDEANYDQDDWNRGMETQSSGLVSDEECKHFARRAFSDGPHFKKARTLIIERLS